MNNTNGVMMFNNVEAEKQVIGALFINPSLIAELTLKPEHLQDSRHQNILYIIKKQYEEEGIEPDPGLICAYAAKINKVDKIGGLQYVTEIGSEIPSSANFKHYETLVLENYKKSELFKLAQNMMNALLNTSTDKVSSDALKAIGELESVNRSKAVNKTIAEVAMEAYENLVADPEETKGISTGFTDLDKITGGYQKKDVVLVGAPPSVGKTVFMTNSAIGVAKAGGAACIISAEMPNVSLGKRMISSEGEVHGRKMRNPENLNEQDLARVIRALGEMSKLPIDFNDDNSIGLEGITRSFYETRKKYPDKKFVGFIDYLQILNLNAKDGNRTHALGALMKGLKRLAKELDMTIVILSQVVRDVNKRDDKRPTMSDVRDSGEIEAVCDIMAFLYREDYQDAANAVDNDKIEFIIRKHRNGELGTVYLKFKKEFSKMETVNFKEHAEMKGRENNEIKRKQQ